MYFLEGLKIIFWTYITNCSFNYKGLTWDPSISQKGWNNLPDDTGLCLNSLKLYPCSYCVFSCFIDLVLPIRWVFLKTEDFTVCFGLLYTGKRHFSSQCWISFPQWRISGTPSTALVFLRCLTSVCSFCLHGAVILLEAGEISVFLRWLKECAALGLIPLHCSFRTVAKCWCLHCWLEFLQAQTYST